MSSTPSPSNLHEYPDHPQPGAGGRLRLGFVMPHFDHGGVEKIVLNLLRHLDRSRFEPALILFKEHGALLDQIPADVEVRALSGKARHLPLRLSRCFTALRLDIVYGGTNAANLASLAAAQLCADPPLIVASEHTPTLPYLQDAKMRFARTLLMRLFYRRAAAIVVPAAPLGDQLRKALGRPNLSVAVLPNPVLEASSASSATVRREAPTFLTAGRLVPEKGYDILLRAFARVCARLPDARLIIFGDGPERESLEQLADALGLSNCVNFAGRVPTPIETHGQGRIFVLSSRREGFPNVLVEALAAGLPIVATDCPVGPRLLLDGGYGLLVAPEDPESLAKGMYRLVTDRSLAQLYRARGPQRVDPFRIGVAVERFSRFMEELQADAKVRRTAWIRPVLAALIVCGAMFPQTPAADDDTSAAYRIGIGDQINVRTFGRPDLTGIFTLGLDGAVRFPLIGSIPVAGRSAGALEKDLSAKLSQMLDYHVEITVDLAHYRPIYVVGDIAIPGEQMYIPGMMALHAFARAGGIPSMQRVAQGGGMGGGSSVQREIVVAQTELTAQLIRRNALDAAITGKPRVTIPEDLPSGATPSLIQRLLGREVALIQQEETALATQAETIRGEKKHLVDEIRSLEQQVNALDAQGRAVADELGKSKELASRGLVNSARMLELRQMVLGSDSARHSASAFLSRARRTMIDLDLQVNQMRDERRQTRLAELRLVEVAIEQARGRLAAAQQQLSSPVELAGLSDRDSGMTLSISRLVDGALTAISAEPVTRLRPGDVLQVKLIPAELPAGDLQSALQSSLAASR